MGGGAGGVECVGRCLKEVAVGVTGAAGAGGGGGGGGNSWCAGGEVVVVC